MKKALLKTVFGLKSNFAQGCSPPLRNFGNISIAPFLGGASASATISADFELAWAYRGRDEKERSLLAKTERSNVPLLVRLLEEKNVPITWATVGHLFLHDCQPGPHAQAHEDMPRPPKNLRWEGDSYRHDPCTDLTRDPDWYAPDLIALIRASKTAHEIGSHSFSHIDFSKSTSTLEYVRREMEVCRDLMAAQGLVLRSLVYPFNNMGHHYLGVLGSMGITAVRHRDEPIRLSYPVRTDSGTHQLCETMNFRRTCFYDYADKAQIFLEEAEKRNAAYHLWFHPSDPTTIFEGEFERIIDLMAKESAAGRLWIATMGQLAAYCEARYQTSLKPCREKNELCVVISSAYDLKRYGPTDLTLEITDCPPPARCEVVTDQGTHLVPWKTRSNHLNGNNPLLINVSATARELRLTFNS